MNKTIFRDLLLILLLGFVFMIVAMIQHINPPQKEDDTDPPGDILAEIVWQAGPIDVDLWVKGPNEGRAVGYSNKSGSLWNLLRDDLGLTGDITELNYEVAYSRGIVAGEYIFNLHCYMCASTFTPVNVTLKVSLKTPMGSTKILVVRMVDLNFKGEEVTAIRFILNKHGMVLPGSMNHIFQPLRSKTQAVTRGR
jgi:hypothetical protein